MRESIGGTWIMGIVALFIFIFAGYLAVTISYSTAFKIKNEVLSIIERNNGMINGAGKITNKDGHNYTSKISSGKTIISEVGSLQTINLYLYGMGYNAMGTCPTEFGWYGVKDLGVPTGLKVMPLAENKNYEIVKSGERYFYCFYGEKRKSYNTIIYKVRLFYRMDLPVLGDMFTFRVDGTTSEIYGFSTNSIYNKEV